MLDELLDVPVNATVMGEPAQLLGIDDGGPHLGLRTTMRRSTGTWAVAVVDIAVNSASSPELSLTLAAYRRWLAGGSA